MNIPLLATSLSGLASINGVMLMQLKKKQFNILCDSIIGPVLYKKMKEERYYFKKQSGIYTFLMLIY